MKELRAKTSGRVQGVSFRYFVKEKAERLDLVGSVRNAEDGSVEVIAQGEKQNLEKLLEFLKKGNSFSKVTDVQVEWREPREDLADFSIVY